MSTALAPLTKECPACGRLLPVETSFYRTARQVSTLCKRCHNAACQARAKAPGYRAKQRAAKARWQQANRERKRLHEGRAIFVQRPGAPEPLASLERLLMELTA